MKNVTKKIVACVMALVMLVGLSLSGQTVTTASAKKAKKKYKAYLAYDGDSGRVSHYEFSGGSVSVKNKKGKANYTLNMKISQCNDWRSEEEKENKVQDTNELSLWINNILDDHKAKDIKVSNVVVKCDGKKVKLDSKKIKQGAVTGEDDVKRYCVRIFASDIKSAKKSDFDWKDKITVSFTVNIKK